MVKEVGQHTVTLRHSSPLLQSYFGNEGCREKLRYSSFKRGGWKRKDQPEDGFSFSLHKTKKMQVVLLGNDENKREWLSAGGAVSANVVWVSDVQEFWHYKDAGAFVDLLFEPEEERVALLRALLPRVVVINSVADTLRELEPSFIRINGWPTFLGATLMEGSCLQAGLRTKGEEVFAALGKEIEWLPDEPGFVTPRVISMIINEAYLALEEGVSTPQEIDAAMKLGTNYPYGPFEWSRRIGVQNIVTLLGKLAERQAQYRPCELLVQETNRAI